MSEPPSAPEFAAIAAARDSAVRDVERTMIQIVQTSISMIGFGFTIHAFLQNAEVHTSLGVDLDQVARRVGLALLTIGMLNLAWGLWNQSRFLSVVRRRHELPPNSTQPGYRVRSTFVIAWLLLTLGAAAFGTMALQMFG